MKKMLVLLLSLFASLSFGAESSPQKLTVILDWFPNPDHAPLIIAKQHGFFKEQGLDVDLIGPSDPSDPPKLVLVFSLIQYEALHRWRMTWTYHAI
jgi:putative hydroxymethylpyrimidine transport system substrate-binding protein